MSKPYVNLRTDLVKRLKKKIKILEAELQQYRDYEDRVNGRCCHKVGECKNATASDEKDGKSND